MEIVSRRVTLSHRGAPVSHTVEFVRLADGRWSSDALFAVRYGEGETVYRRALVLRVFPYQPALNVGDLDFAPFRDLPPALLGWADRMTAGIHGIPTSSAPENSDRDEVRLARLFEAHLPPELVAGAAPAPDEGILDEPMRTSGIGELCVFCGAPTGIGSNRHLGRRRTSATTNLAHWLPASERSSSTMVEGWACSECTRPAGERSCACPVCPDCEDPFDPTAGARCESCADACPPYFTPVSAAAPSVYAPLPGVYLHGRLEDRAGTDQLLAIDAPRLVDRLLAGSTRVECEAYVMLGATQVEAVAVLWRRGPDDVRGLVLESGDEVAIEYAEARAAELADSL